MENINVKTFLKIQSFSNVAITKSLLFLDTFDINDIYIRRNKVVAYADYNCCYLAITIDTYYKRIDITLMNKIDNSKITLLNDYLENIEIDDTEIYSDLKNIAKSFININSDRID